MNTGLLLIDIQNDYFPGGKYELFQAEKAAVQAKEMLTFFRKHKLPIFHVQHINKTPTATFFLPDSTGVNFHQSVFPQTGEIIIRKNTPDSFFKTILKPELEKKNIDHLAVCGMMTHMCVDTTVRAARNSGYTITLIEDACATKDLEWKQINIPAAIVQAAFMAALSDGFAKITTLAEWEEHASISV